MLHILVNVWCCQCSRCGHFNGSRLSVHTGNVELFYSALLNEATHKACLAWHLARNSSFVSGSCWALISLIINIQYSISIIQYSISVIQLALLLIFNTYYLPNILHILPLSIIRAKEGKCYYPQILTEIVLSTVEVEDLALGCVGSSQKKPTAVGSHNRTHSDVTSSRGAHVGNGPRLLLSFVLGQGVLRSPCASRRERPHSVAKGKNMSCQHIPC